MDFFTSICHWWTFWRFSQKVHHSHVSVMDFLDIFPKSPSLSCVSDGLFKLSYKKSITYMCHWWTFSLQYVNDGLFEDFSKKSIIPMCQWWTFQTFFQKVHHSHVSVMDFMNIFPKSPSLPCVSDGLYKHFSKKSITSMCQWWTL